jgi:PAS domain S-box-containing protein
MTEAPATILLVDDRPENLLALEAILEPLGQGLVRAYSGEDALREVLRHDFAVILMDVQMPGMNGFETAELLKARDKSKHVPIIFLTAISKDDEYVFQGYTVGAVDYMFKPLNPDILRSKVNVFVELYMKTRELQRQDELIRESEKRELEMKHMGELLESEARVAAIVSSAQEAIITFDKDQCISLFNSAAERMFGRPAGAVLGKVRLEDLLEAESRGRFADRMRRAVRTTPGLTRPSTRTPELDVLSGIRSDGTRFPIELSLSLLELTTSQVYTAIVRDITERQKAEEALKAHTVALANTTEELTAVNDELHERQRELEKAISARSRFYASMSHELRTPINAILGYSSLLLDNVYGSLNERQVNGIERTHRAAKHLLELVNDILDLSKIEAGKMELQLEPVVFPGVIEDLFVTVRPLADEHGSELSLHDAVSRTIVSDPRRVRQIVLNLLSNAIKFGRGKPIRVECRALEDGGIEVDVIDQGVGIAEEDLDKIFDEFVQLSKTSRQEGTGLGLPISKRLAEALGGSLIVESRVSIGSTFRLTLPQHADGAATSGARRREPEVIASALG